MKEIIWVVGASASGKETFIKKLSNQSPELSHLGFKNKKVVVCKQSIDLIGQFNGDPTDTMRENIIDESTRLLTDNDMVIIKWQFVDTETNRIERLSKKFPEAKVKIFYLTAPKLELAERLKNKPWWKGLGDEIEHVENELVRIITILDDIKEAYEITTVNSSKEGNYACKTEITKNQPMPRWSAILLINPEGKIIAMHRDNKPEIRDPNKYGVFGGSADSGEVPLETAVRELDEETNLVFKESDLNLFKQYYIEREDIKSPGILTVYYIKNIDEKSLKIFEGQGIKIISQHNMVNLGKDIDFVFKDWFKNQ